MGCRRPSAGKCLRWHSSLTVDQDCQRGLAGAYTAASPAHSMQHSMQQSDRCPAPAASHHDAVQQRE